MEVTHFEHRAYIKIAVLQGRNSPCDFDIIPKIKEPIRGRWFATREDIANAERQQVTRFTYGAANVKVNGIQRLPHRCRRVVTVAGDYSEGLWAQICHVNFKCSVVFLLHSEGHIALYTTVIN
ncbi:uncharacterized protein TNCV_4601191 [Trichonephila clavipes]|nr:uncharacterized protein TNCV_4601191 [Trichonephila clavipes]